MGGQKRYQRDRRLGVGDSRPEGGRRRPRGGGLL